VKDYRKKRQRWELMWDRRERKEEKRTPSFLSWRQMSRPPTLIRVQPIMKMSGGSSGFPERSLMELGWALSNLPIYVPGSGKHSQFFPLISSLLSYYNYGVFLSTYSYKERKKQKDTALFVACSIGNFSSCLARN
jgi:hypothetical protein